MGGAGFGSGENHKFTVEHGKFGKSLNTQVELSSSLQFWRYVWKLSLEGSVDCSA